MLTFICPLPSLQPLVLAPAEAMADFKDEIETVMKDRADRFEESMEAEEKIRLGETGWKAR